MNASILQAVRKGIFRGHVPSVPGRNISSAPSPSSMNLLNLNSTVCAIGDVHGRSDLLESLIKFIDEHSAETPRRPRVYFLGDIVDRGPDSRGAMNIVCETLKRWPESRLLLGNHDFMFRDSLTEQRFVEDWFARGAATTLTSYLGHSDCFTFDDLREIKERFEDHLEVLQSASLSEILGQYLFVHAGINPARPADDQNLSDLLQIRGSFLDHVSHLSHVVVHGHSPLTPPLPVVTENRISLDTNAVYTDVLTMVMIDTDSNRMEFYSTGQSGTVRATAPVLIDRGLGVACNCPTHQKVY
ncbi:metallophosphoesterase [Rhodopseudomonas palustris]|uniref:metallophosphoesterase n=1 Tax=Rhodopseudomonas palustris TaxID=1076 RepID=UPI0014040EC4|nr:metallophosphoesterase [Rhodopseudomonas palustris]QLH71672.1 serine/threonine protein phosphatase [Rhodopseudomonas palustris]